jgi:L-iditol 2-dehydrogenase
MVPKKMTAAVLYGQEDVRVEECDVPSIGPGEVLLRIEAALTCGTDAKVYRRGYHARMLTPPTVFGHEAAGTIVAVGAGVSELEPGMAVVTANSAPCGICEFCRVEHFSLCEDLLFWNGAYAEYARIPARIVEKNLLRLPEGFPFRKAALLEPLACAVRGVAACRIQPGQDVAIIGAGSLGLMLLQLATRQGARVTMGDRKRGPLEVATRLGAVAVVPAEEGSLSERLLERSPGGRGFPVVIEAVGRVETSSAALAAVRKGGTVSLFGGCAAGSHLTVDIERLHYQELSLIATFHHTPASVREAYRLIVEGAINADDYIIGEVELGELPGVLADIAAGRRTHKTVVLPLARR